MNKQRSNTHSGDGNRWVIRDADRCATDCIHFASRRLALIVAVSLVMGACADSPSAPMNASPSSRVIPTPSEALNVAQGLASAMRDVSIRKQVQGAMRASLVNEHKLVLQDYLNSADGEAILSATANALNVTVGSLQSTIANLPKLDFYAPFKEHRLTWKSESDVYVAATFDKDAPTLTAYGTDGRTVTLQRDRGVPDVPLLILHPAELKLARSAPQPNTPGDLIQDAADGVVATRSVPGAVSLVACIEPYNVGPDGRFRLDQVSALCGGGGGGGGVSAPPPTPGVYINHFNIQEGDGWFGDSEMQFRSYAVSGYRGFLDGADGRQNWLLSDPTCALGTYYQNGVQEDLGYYGAFLISPGVTYLPGLSCNGKLSSYAINIVEIDGGLNLDDDNYGYRFYSRLATDPYPFGATMGVVFSFYEKTSGWDVGYPTGTRTAYLRTEIK